MDIHNRDKYSETRSQIGDAGGTWKSLQKLQCLRDQEDSGASLALQKRLNAADSTVPSEL